MFFSLNNFIERTYKYIEYAICSNILKMDPGSDGKKFMRNFYYVFMGTIPNQFLIFIYNIYAGRMLGPTEYGSYILLQSISFFLYIPMLLGINTSMIKFLSEDEDLNKKIRIISTTYLFVIVSSLISIIIYILCSPLICNAIRITPEFFYLSLILTIAFVLYNLSISTLRGLFKMKIYSAFQVIYALILLLAFILFTFEKNYTFKAMTYSVIIAYMAASILIILIVVREYLCLRFDLYWFKRLIKYSSFSLIGGLSSVLYLNVDKIFVNKYMSITDLGIYGVYSMIIYSVVSFFSATFITVLFPFASQYDHKEIIYNIFNRFLLQILMIGIPILMIAQYIIIFLLGNRYSYDLGLSLLFAFAGIFICIDSTYGWLMNAIGEKGAKITSCSAVALACSDITLNILLIPRIGIKGAVISMMISYLISISILRYNNRFLNTKEN